MKIGTIVLTALLAVPLAFAQSAVKNGLVKATDANGFTTETMYKDGRAHGLSKRYDGSGQLVYETADLWFHSLVMLDHLGASAKDVLEELDRRFGTSGLAEKAARSAKP